MNRVVPRYVPANTIEERMGFLVTAEKTEGGRVYLGRSGSWSDIGDARFYDEPLHAADGLKDMRERATDGYSDVNVDSIELVRVVGMLIPTIISEAELRKQRRAEAMSKLSQDEIEALGLDKVNFEAMEKPRENEASRLRPPVPFHSENGKRGDDQYQASAHRET